MNSGLILALFFIGVVISNIESCDINVHVKSQTEKPFKAEVVAPNGQKSSKWDFTKKRQRETFQQKAGSDCGLKEWQINVYDASTGAQKFNEKVSLNGIGRVVYEVNDNLEPIQKERQGAICNGKCAALGITPPASPTNSRKSSTSSN